MSDLPKHGNGERGKFVYDNKTGKLKPYEKKRTIADAPYFHSDEIEPTESMATCNREFFTSKSRLRRHYKQHGFEETGGERIVEGEKQSHEAYQKELRDDIEKSYYDIKYDRVPWKQWQEEDRQRLEQLNEELKNGRK